MTYMVKSKMIDTAMCLNLYFSFKLKIKNQSNQPT